MNKKVTLYNKSSFTHLDVQQYDKMKGVTIEICNGQRSEGFLFNDVSPHLAIACLQEIIKCIEVKKYPLSYGTKAQPLVIKDKKHEDQIIKFINGLIEQGSELHLIGQKRHLNHLYNLKNRIVKGQRLSPKMTQNLFFVFEKLKEQ